MFSFFKKQSNLGSEFYADFTEEEKLITLNMLFLAGMIDTDTFGNSQNSINKEAEFLNYYVGLFNTSSNKANAMLKKLGHAEIISRFKAMEKYKIENVLMLILGMLNADGPVNETEDIFFSRILQRVNISEEEFSKKLRLAEAILKNSNK